MRKLFLIITTCLLFVTKSHTQTLTIDELIVSYIKFKNNPKVIDEGDGNGPHINVTFTIHNSTKENIFLNMDSINVAVCFKYNGKKYLEDMIWQPFKQEGDLILPPNVSKKFSTSTYIFLGTQIWNEKKEDYTLELLQVLPTLRIKYQDAKVELMSTAIKNVKIK